MAASFTPTYRPPIVGPAGPAGDGGDGISVLNYGAVGDGTADDTEAILEAFDAGIAAKVPVKFPMTDGGGIYKIVSTNQPGRIPAIQLDSSYSNLKLVGAAGAGIYVDSVCIDGVSGSPGIELLSGFSGLDVENLTFYGPDNDDKDLNFFAAIQMGYGSSDLRIRNCTFDHITPVNAASAPQSSDELPSSRLLITGCLIKNSPNGIHPPSDFKITDNFFICDERVSTRSQAVYKFGAFSNGQLSGNTFYRINKQAIQIRGVEAQWNQMKNFRIIGNTFIECDHYAIFCGSDSFPSVEQAVIANNTFLNCNGAIQAQGLGTPQITGNVLTYTWEWPFEDQGSGVGINVTTGVGLPGHYSAAGGANVVGNKLSIAQPFMGKVQFTGQPSDGDTITVGSFTYTWRTSPDELNEIEIGATTRLSTNSFVEALRGFSDNVTSPNNVLRSSLDAFANFYGSNPTLAIVASGRTFTMSASGSYCTITATRDMRAACPYPIRCDYVIAAHVADNTFDNFQSGIVMNGCRGGEVFDNKNTSSTPNAIIALDLYSVDMRWRGNRCINLDWTNQGAPAFNQYHSGFSVIDDDHVQPQEGTNTALMGRAGIVTIGDGKAFNWLWYGRGIDSDDPSTIMFRWHDGDEVKIYNGSTFSSFYYKRTSPGAGEFSTADELVALLGTVSGVDAEFAPYTNRLGTADPKVMIRVFASAAGTAGNNMRLYVTRYKWPGDTSTFATVQQPLINGIILRDLDNFEYWSPFHGGAATRVKTFVYTPIANKSNGVQVWGANSTAAALNPRVYAADIYPGVGFEITHDEGAGTEQFHYRVNT